MLITLAKTTITVTTYGPEDLIASRKRVAYSTATALAWIAEDIADGEAAVEVIDQTPCQDHTCTRTHLGDLHIETYGVIYQHGGPVFRPAPTEI